MNFPTFKWGELFHKEKLGQGAFGKVYKAECLSFLQPVAVKKLECRSAHEERLFIKEVKLFFSCRHDNIVKALAMCSTPCSLMLEFMEFSFLSYGKNKVVNTLKDLLSYCHQEFHMKGFEQYPVKIASQVISGLSYLHSKEIVHRDLKPGNILVSNAQGKFVCKITDFGESRGIDIETETTRDGSRRDIRRGTLFYMAPELHVSSHLLSYVDISHLKAADIWSYGMVLFNILNPDLTVPYEIEMKELRGISNVLILKEALRKRQKPMFSSVYPKRNFKKIIQCFIRCLNFKPSSRPSSESVHQLISGESCSSSKILNLKRR